MFWDSVIAGLKVLTYWETYVAGLEYLAIFLTPIIIIGIIMKNNTAVSGVTGCLGMLLMPVFQVVALAVMILTLAPIIFGFAEDAVWGFPWQLMTMAPSLFFKLIGVLIVTAIVLAFIPILGQLKSLHTLVLGGMALMFVLGIIDSTESSNIQDRVDFIPGFWFSTGLIVIGGIMAWVGIMVAAIIVTSIKKVDEGLGQLIIFPIAAIFGFIPVFMYGAWLGAQVRGGF